jgi:predicted ATPase
MWLEELSLSSFKNLRDFTVRFDASLHTVLVGVNGSGKSNLLEALVSLFSELHGEETAPFSYSIKYRCGEAAVEIDGVEGENPTFQVNGESIKRGNFYAKNADGYSDYLPRFVFGYYSGASDRFHEYFVEHQRAFYKKLKDPKADPNRLPFRPLFLAKPTHGQFVLLAFYSHEDDQLRQFLAKNLGILDLESVLFVIKKPGWQKKKVTDRFWGAQGIPRVFLDKVFEHSLAPMRLPRPLDVGFREKPKSVDCWNLFLDRAAFRKLADGYHRPQDFFKTLESTDISDLLMEVRVQVKVLNHDGSISFRELSEGEQQLLLVLGLLRFTKEDEALFLLDEPDTHLNPQWSVQYLQFIENIVGKQPSSHILMATHDPLVFAGLMKSEVRIMQRDAAAQRIVAVPPDEDPRGMGIEAILTSDLFGLLAALDLNTLAELDEKRDLQAIKVRTPAQDLRLKDLTERLGNLAFTRSSPDPLYAQYVEKMTEAQAKEGLLLPTLTTDQQARQEKLAAEVIEEIRKKDRLE